MSWPPFGNASFAGLSHDVHWAPLTLIIDTSQVFADHAEGHQLHASEKEQRHHERGIALDRVSKKQGLHQEIQGVEKGHERHDKPEIGGDAQRGIAKRQDAIQGEAPEAHIVPGGLSGLPRGPMVVHRRGTKPHPGKEPLHEPAALRQLPQGIQDRAAQEPEITRVFRDRDLADAVEDPVEGMRAGALYEALAVPRQAHGIDHVIARMPTLHEFRDELGGVLEIGIEGDRRRPSGMIKPGGERGLLAEIAREIDDPDAGIFLAQGDQDGQRLIAAAIVYADALPSLGTRGHDRAEAFMEGADIGGLVITGDHE